MVVVNVEVIGRPCVVELGLHFVGYFLLGVEIWCASHWGCDVVGEVDVGHGADV